jgi:glycosyltransferase involved in cell wall biosynthesis
MLACVLSCFTVCFFSVCFASSMNILIDTGKLKDLYSGLGQVSLHFGKAIASLQQEQLRFTFLVPPGNEGIFGHDVSYLADTLPNRLQLKFSGAKNFQLLHYLHQDVKNWLRPAGLPYMVTLHDLNFLYHKSPAKVRHYLRRLTNLLKSASCITCISKFTATDVQQHVPGLNIPLQVIYNGVEDLSYINASPPKLAITGSYLFSIGVLHPKKNFEQLIEMMPFVQQHTLVIAGSGNEGYKQSLLQKARALKVDERILFTGTVNAAEKKWLYEHCTAFVFTSKAEGFGLPVIEAMQLGKPVFLLKSTSLPEIGSSYAQYWEKDDNGKIMAEKLNKGLELYQFNESLLQDMKNYAAGFNWENNAKAYIKLYQQLLNQ